MNMLVRLKTAVVNMDEFVSAALGPSGFGMLVTTKCGTVEVVYGTRDEAQADLDKIMESHRGRSATQGRSFADPISLMTARRPDPPMMAPVNPVGPQGAGC
jgi:hypothetical protein